MYLIAKYAVLAINILLKMYHTVISKNLDTSIFNTKIPSGTIKSHLNEIKLVPKSLSLYNFIVNSQKSYFEFMAFNWKYLRKTSRIQFFWDRVQVHTEFLGEVGGNQVRSFQHEGPQHGLATPSLLFWTVHRVPLALLKDPVLIRKKAHWELTTLLQNWFFAAQHAHL